MPVPEFPVTTMSVLTPDGQTVTFAPSAEQKDITIIGLANGDIKLTYWETWAIRQGLNTIFHG